MAGPPAPSKYQLAILEELAASDRHIVILATAGAGKTTVLEQIARSLPQESRQLFLAFARDAAAELKKRLPAGVDTRTVHSLGRQIVQRALTSRNGSLLPPQPHKYRKLARELLNEREPELATADARHFLVELASAARLQLTDASDTAALHDLMNERGLWAPCSLDEVDRLFRLVPELLSRGLQLAGRGSLDFVDMLFVPVHLQLPVPTFDLVCVDEAQDYSPLALELTLRLASAGARLVFVGDPRQCIFGFAGADPDAMELITERLAAKVLPLSVTYRCPRLHVELARELAPEMEAAPSAAAGTVSVISTDELAAWARPRDLVLCRLNAPLIAACLSLSAAGLPAFVRGADLLERLLALATKVFRGESANRALQLDRHEHNELRRLRSGELTAPAAAQERLKDECACLRHVLASLGPEASLNDVEQSVTRAFGGGKGSLVLSTIHRAKGQEADRVLLLHPELLPAPYARSLRALRGEACVQFVALTRAKRDLILVESTANEGRPRRESPRGNELEPADLERERLLAAWQSVLFKARAGRRHRTVRA